jgi:hypothetical protein
LGGRYWRRTEVAKQIFVVEFEIEDGYEVDREVLELLLADLYHQKEGVCGGLLKEVRSVSIRNCWYCDSSSVSEGGWYCPNCGGC